MPYLAPPSLPNVADVTLYRGSAAAPDATPDLLFEVAHGATRAADFDALARQLRGPLPPDLRAFFFVNTDVGAPELAERAAHLAVTAAPKRSALVIRCLVPRTFVDCNRLLDEGARPMASAAGAMTPGLPPYVREPHDVDLLLRERYLPYRRLVSEQVQAICGAGGETFFVHTYAPRSVDVPVDERIVERLRLAYEPDHVGRWPLRAEVDLITNDPEGRLWASPDLVERAEGAFRAAGLGVARNAAYALHPSSLAHAFAVRHPGRTLCFEVRRDLLVAEFTPFQEMRSEPSRVERVARALAQVSSSSR